MTNEEMARRISLETGRSYKRVLDYVDQNRSVINVIKRVQSFTAEREYKQMLEQYKSYIADDPVWDDE